LENASLHPVFSTQTFVTVILPIAVRKPYTYAVPEEMVAKVRFGLRVEVQFGKNKLYTALVMEVHQQAPEGYRPKPILSVIDEQPIIQPTQLRLWKWMANYYCCTLGEVMNAALPANLKLTSETRLVLSPMFDEDFTQLNDQEYLIAEALTIQNELSIDDVRQILDRKTVYPLVRRLLEKQVVYLKEDLKTKYKPKKVGCVRFQEPYRSRPELINEAFELLGRSQRQTDALLAFVQLYRKLEFVRKQDIYSKTNTDISVLRAMEKKGIFELYDREVSRLGSYEEETVDAHTLSDQQTRALREMKAAFAEKSVALLHGVTGSGKTRVYIEMIREAIDRGEQVLYLLPEIALTAQIIERLQRVFGDDISVYHSKLNNNERVELWNSVLEGKPVILGARSAIFLPFSKLKLIIVDEEHDPSFKQRDPAPRYQGRDVAIVLAQFHGAKTILGTATPALETYHNAKTGKYGLVEMSERFGGIKMPEVKLIDAKSSLYQQKQSHFTPELIEALQTAIDRDEQAILFQNRRGYSPVYRCTTCEWVSQCIHCDVSLTYHKFHNALKCHYCGYQTKLPPACPACGNKHLHLKGFGTEKIEDELKIFLPTARISRMDLDTVRGKHAHVKLLNDFEEGRIDILVGTQMVTKGLDFEKVAIVGVLSSDQLLQFPDFRASERAFQLMVQVAGRSGRKGKQGKVLIQAFNTAHPVLSEVLTNDYKTFFERELAERQAFRYPPFQRLIRITLKHKKPNVLNDASRIFDKDLKVKLGNWVIGPAVPYVSRVRTYYLMDFMIKLDRNAKKIQFAKNSIWEAIDKLHGEQGFSGVRVNVDVDPY
jgi:primosomal protein N' (replication factor Y)